LAGLAAADLAVERLLVADSALAARVVLDSRPLVARLPGPDPLTAFAAALPDSRLAAVFLAGVLVAVRFTGASVARLAFVAATYTLSVLGFRWAHACTTEKRLLCRMSALISARILAAIR
jgi:hypothetical protein